MTTSTRRTKKTEGGPQPEPPTRKRALVTGASAGLGEEFARQLAKRGYDLVLVARRKDRMDALAADLRESRGVDVEVIEADLSAADGVSATLKRIEQGDIDMLVNNAGFGTNGSFVNLPIERELEELDLNIRALTQLSHAALQHMKRKNSGTIINVASTGAYQPVPYMATYAATKAFVLSFSEALHEEAKSYGVTVTCLCPGPTRTEFQAVAGVRTEQRPAFFFAESAPVVKAALNAAKKGSAICTPGVMNVGSANLSRVFPRFAVRKIAGRVFKKE